MKTKAQREYELSGMMLRDKPALHREYRRVTKRTPHGETDRVLILAILNKEYPPKAEPRPRNKTREQPSGRP